MQAAIPGSMAGELRALHAVRQQMPWDVAPVAALRHVGDAREHAICDLVRVVVTDAHDSTTHIALLIVRGLAAVGQTLLRWCYTALDPGEIADGVPYCGKLACRAALAWQPAMDEPVGLLRRLLR